MTCHFGYYCRDCKETSEMPLNWGVGHLQYMFINRKLIVEFYQLNKKVPDFIPIADFRNETYIEFLVIHQNHSLYLEDEYGHVYPIFIAESFLSSSGEHSIQFKDEE